MKTNWGAATLLLLILIASSALANYEIGDTVDDFTLFDLQGIPVSLSDYSGHVVLINFFATWCPPCNDEAPLLEELWQTHQEDDFVILGVDLLENPALVAEWVQALALTYPVLLATDWSLFQLFPQAGGFPYNAVIDKTGVLRYAQYGINIEEIGDLVQELLTTGPVNSVPASLSAVKALYR